MSVRDPRFDAARAVTEAITGQSMSEDDLNPEATGRAGRGETRVVLPMDAWDELEYLAADDTEEPTDLFSRLYLAWQKLHPGEPDENVLCEGEEEGEVWTFYCQGLSADELLTVVQEAIPENWTASLVGEQITIARG
jgi:hypothetical protein